MKDNKPLSTEAYKGMRDFYPEDMALQNYIFKTMSEVAESFGYVQYGAPILEETDLYRAKTGEEIVNEQTYSFTDRGGRDVTMRPEMTPSVARMIAKKRQELTFPLRWYSIPNLYRYERPQRGRLREHFQLNVDMFGVENIAADKEIIKISYEIMKKFGAEDSSFEIKVNDRRIIKFLLEDILKLNSESAYTLSKLIDRKAKISQDDFKAQATEIVGQNIILLIEVLDTKTINDLPPEFNNLDAVLELRQLIHELNDSGVANIVFDPTLMRGFDYYTKMVFEVFDRNPINNRSLFGGGRYDDLVSLFGVEKVPGVGFGMGDITIKDYLESCELVPAILKSTTDLYVCVMSAEYISFAEKFASDLRACGVNVAIDFTNRKLSAQIKTADKQQIRYVVCIGEDEVKNNIYKVKDLVQNREYPSKLSEVVELINN